MTDMLRRHPKQSSGHPSRPAPNDAAVMSRLAMRPSSLRRIIPVMLLALIGACNGRPSDDADSGPPLEMPTGDQGLPAAAEGPTEREPDSVDASWAFVATDTGSALVLAGSMGEVLRIACGGSPLQMTVDVPAFESIGSEERLSLGLDDEPFVFVAQVTPPPPSGVHAEREPDESFLRLFANSGTLSAVYGAQRTGPHAAPDQEDANSFVNACLQAMSG